MCNPWKKDFYLDTLDSFDLDFTLFESTTLSKLSYIKKQNKFFCCKTYKHIKIMMKIK